MHNGVRCPSCQVILYCSCKNCAMKNIDLNKWIWEKDDYIRCSCCGYTMHVDKWQDLMYDEYKKNTGR